MDSLPLPGRGKNWFLILTNCNSQLHIFDCGGIVFTNLKVIELDIQFSELWISGACVP